MERFSPLPSADPVLNVVQAQLQRILGGLVGVELLEGRLVEGVSLAAGSNEFAHGLGRVLRGWAVVRRSSAATLYDTQDTNTRADKTLQLTASATITVSLWVF